MILLSAQGKDPNKIARVTFTSVDRVRDVIHNFNTDGFDSLYPKYRGDRVPTFTPARAAGADRVGRRRDWRGNGRRR
jgi:hypothetical protein